jgi:hypothetical protein
MRLQEHGGARYLNMKVTLTEGKSVTRAWSSRCGDLKLRHEGGSVTVVMPLEYADVLIFKRDCPGAEKQAGEQTHRDSTLSGRPGENDSPNRSLLLRWARPEHRKHAPLRA